MGWVGWAVFLRAGWVPGSYGHGALGDEIQARFITGRDGRWGNGGFLLWFLISSFPFVFGFCTGVRDWAALGVVLGFWGLWFQVGERDSANRSSWSAGTVDVLLFCVFVMSRYARNMAGRLTQGDAGKVAAPFALTTC